MMFRREMFCVLDRLYKDVEEMPEKGIHPLSKESVTECLMLVIFALMMRSSMRWEVSNKIHATDAEGSGFSGMTEMEMTQEFADSKIAVHAITAEPGTEGELRGRLSKAGLPDLKYNVVSDPSWSLMTLKPKDEIYVPGNPHPDTGYSHPFPLKTEGPDKYCDPYHMVQPAVVIVDKKGEVRSWWSWNRLQAGMFLRT